MPSSGRVIVAYVCTSCSRRPGRSSSGTRTQHTSSALPISSAATRAMICSSSCVSVSIWLPPTIDRTEVAAAARRSHGHCWRNLILVLAATLKGPGLAPRTRLINDLEDQGSDGVSGQQPPPIFRPERASPQGISMADKEEVRGSSPRSPTQVKTTICQASRPKGCRPASTPARPRAPAQATS